MVAGARTLVLCCLLPLCYCTRRAASKLREVQVPARGEHESHKHESTYEQGHRIESEGGVLKRCQNMPWNDKLTVAARWDEDTSWMASYLVPWMPFLVISTSQDKAATHGTLSNVGREAQAYLQFIVDYYECLPKEIAFVHAHRSSPHSPDMLEELKRIRWGEVPGFLSLSRPNQVSTYWLSEPEKHKPAGDVGPEDANWMEFAYSQTLHIREAWPKLFEEFLGSMPSQLAAPCCGQFAVTRERVQHHPKRFYQAALRWLQVSKLDYFWAGLIFEHTWPYIFGAGTSYTHPEECRAFTCDGSGAPITLPWESLMSPRPGCT